MPGSSRDGAVTGLEFLLLLAVGLILAGFVAHILVFPPSPPEKERGIIAGSIQQSGDQLNVFGSITGFPAVTGSYGGVTVVRRNPDPMRLGGIGMTLSLFVGSTGGVDMARTNVTWTDNRGTYVLSLTMDRPVLCPNWTIAGRYNINPFKTADDDLVLEAGEQFAVLACPADPLTPYEEFTVVFDPPGPGPRFPVRCTVPFQISPSMEL